jgi:hypothetical protein
MASHLVICRRLSSLWIALAIWLCAALPVHAQLLSPGSLSKAHAELEGDGQCQRCHATGAQVAEPRCLDCHKDIAGDRRGGIGMHGTVFRGDSCASCHVEHLGAKVSLIRWPGPDPKKFDHGKTVFPLRGAHGKVECRECHDDKNERGNPTFLQADRKCASCHEDPHEKRFGERCADCHNETKFTQVDLNAFDHKLARFPLDGAHQRVACAECHEGTPPKYRDLSFGDCSSCHKDPHAGRLKGTCKSCHAADAWTRIIMPREKHPVLSILAGHLETPCKSCHDEGLKVPPSKGKECVSCHKPVHEAPFGEKCEQCHASIKFTGLPDAIGRKVHSQTVFPLKGQHGKVECAECHLAELSRNERYRRLRYEQCASCHADAHKGTLREHGDCATCHDPLGFAPSLVQPNVHAKFGFPLEGNHEAAACSACHKSHVEPPRLSWTVGQGKCADCHQNPHGDQFAAEMQLGGCGHCHSPKGWGLANIDHSFWPLTGAHATTACKGCHAQASALSLVKGKGKPLVNATYEGAPRECEGCHDDVHAGQFRSTEPVRACESCHQTTAFVLPDFDHQKLTDYPLEGKHKQTTCASCHPSVHLKSGDEVTRYRLGYTKCADCHADPHTIPEATSP